MSKISTSSRDSIIFTKNDYSYTFLHRIYHVLTTIKCYEYNPFDFKTHTYDSVFSRYVDIIKDTPWTRLKYFIGMVVNSYKYTPETIKYWKENEARLSCQEKQLRAMDITGNMNDLSLIQPEEATCVLWHDDKSSDVLKQMLDLSYTQTEPYKQRTPFNK